MGVFYTSLGPVGLSGKILLYKGKCHVHPSTEREGPEGEWTYSCTLSLTCVLNRGGCRAGPYGCGKPRPARTFLYGVIDLYTISTASAPKIVQLRTVRWPVNCKAFKRKLFCWSTRLATLSLSWRDWGKLLKTFFLSEYSNTAPR